MGAIGATGSHSGMLDFICLVFERSQGVLGASAAHTAIGASVLFGVGMGFLSNAALGS